MDKSIPYRAVERQNKGLEPTNPAILSGALPRFFLVTGCAGIC